VRAGGRAGGRADGAHHPTTPGMSRAEWGGTTAPGGWSGRYLGCGPGGRGRGCCCPGATGRGPCSWGSASGPAGLAAPAPPPRAGPPSGPPQVLSALQLARDTGPNWPKAWHNWALFNVAVMDHFARRGEAARAQQHVAPAVQGFFKRCARGTGPSCKGGCNGGCSAFRWPPHPDQARRFHCPAPHTPSTTMHTHTHTSPPIHPSTRPPARPPPPMQCVPGLQRRLPHGQPAGHPAPAHALVHARLGPRRGAGAAGGLCAAAHRHLAGGHPADHRAHPHQQPAGERPGQGRGAAPQAACSSHSVHVPPPAAP
jgi:hypothetical protein